MKRVIYDIIGVFIVLLCVGCADTYSGLKLDMSGDDILEQMKEDEETDTDIDVEADRMPVQIAVTDPSFTYLGTRGLGGFDTTRPEENTREQWELTTFHIFGVRRGQDVSYDDISSFLVYDAPAGQRDTKSGMLQFLGNANTDGRYLYPSDNQANQPYQFFACYLDTLPVISLVHTVDEVVMTVDIDGSQDILYGQAHLTDKQKQKLLEQADGEDIEKLAYSEYTARRYLYPVVDLKHALTRFKVRIYPGEEKAQGLYIDSIRVKSRFKTHLTVAARDEEKLGPKFDAQQTWLQLHDEKADTLARDVYHVTWTKGDEKKDVYSRASMQVGESLLLPPTTGFEIEVHGYRKEEGKEKVPILTNYTLSLASGFKAGYEYTIRAVLYGEKEISLSAVLTGWQKGNDITIDEDDLFDYK